MEEGGVVNHADPASPDHEGGRRAFRRQSPSNRRDAAERPGRDGHAERGIAPSLTVGPRMSRGECHSSLLPPPPNMPGKELTPGPLHAF